MFLILWRFRPAARYLAEFREAYGPGGVWHQLFRTSTEYVGLELLQPADPEGWWITVDRWRSRAAFEEFRESHRDRYEEIDGLCASFTRAEELVGQFELIESAG